MPDQVGPGAGLKTYWPPGAGEPTRQSAPQLARGSRSWAAEGEAGAGFFLLNGPGRVPPVFLVAARLGGHEGAASPGPALAFTSADAGLARRPCSAWWSATAVFTVGWWPM